VGRDSSFELGRGLDSYKGATGGGKLRQGGESLKGVAVAAGTECCLHHMSLEAGAFSGVHAPGISW
jgi:hypothetical protein